jgi:hypothetical protein
MPKMIKVVISRPSTDVAWGIPADENPGADIVASYDIVEAKTKHDSTDPAGYVAQTVFDSPDTLHLTRYFKFDNYPDTTPADLRSWFWKNRRAVGDTMNDATASTVDPITGDAVDKTYNKYSKWINMWFTAKKITYVSVEEVEQDFT